MQINTHITMETILSKRRGFLNSRGYLPHTVVLTKEHLCRLNECIQLQMCHVRLKEEKAALRPELMPTYVPRRDMTFGDTIYGMVLVETLEEWGVEG